MSYKEKIHVLRVYIYCTSILLKIDRTPDIVCLTLYHTLKKNRGIRLAHPTTQGLRIAQLSRRTMQKAHAIVYNKPYMRAKYIMHA